MRMHVCALSHRWATWTSFLLSDLATTNSHTLLPPLEEKPSNIKEYSHNWINTMTVTDIDAGEEYRLLETKKSGGWIFVVFKFHTIL